MACGRQAGGAASDTVAPADTGRGYVIEPLSVEELRVDGATGSLEELLRTVERGLAESDTVRLTELMIDEREYRDILFSAFPVSHPHQRRIRDRLDPAVPGLLPRAEAPAGTVRRKGHPRARRSLRSPGPGLRQLHPARDQPCRRHGGRRLLHDVRLFGSVIRIGDQWKVLTYPDHPDDPS